MKSYYRVKTCFPLGQVELIPWLSGYSFPRNAFCPELGRIKLRWVRLGHASAESDLILFEKFNILFIIDLFWIHFNFLKCCITIFLISWVFWCPFKFSTWGECLSCLPSLSALPSPLFPQKYRCYKNEERIPFPEVFFFSKKKKKSEDRRWKGLGDRNVH